MNYNQKLFDEIIQRVSAVLTDTTDLPTIQNGFYRSLAIDYCPELLIKVYNATKEDFKEPKRMLELAFAAGCFCRMVNDISKDEDSNKYINISSALSNAVLTIDGMLVGLLLNSNAVKSKETFKIAQSLAVDECLNLTYQKSIILGDDGILKDTMTVLYAMFLLGCSQKIKYH